MNEESGQHPAKAHPDVASKTFPPDAASPDFDQRFDELLNTDPEDYPSENAAKDFDDEMEVEFGHRSRKRRSMHCFHCNRREGHYSSYTHRWYYNFLVGLTFGLIRLIGPFHCQCCGHRRLMFSDKVNVRYWFLDKSRITKLKAFRNRRH